MRQLHHRLRILVATTLALGMLVSVASAPAGAATLYKRDVYFTAGYERQIDSRTCTAASTAMMLNFIARRDLHLDQQRILRYAQANDALNDARQRGSDPLGWSRALTYFSTTTGRQFTYRWESYTSEYSALKRGAKQIALYGRPVGLLVQSGKHAMVMTGFESTSDPRYGEFRLVAVWVSDPYGLTRKRYLVADSPLNKYLELDATRQYDEAWYGRYVIIAPV